VSPRDRKDLEELSVSIERNLAELRRLKGTAINFGLESLHDEAEAIFLRELAEVRGVLVEAG